MAALVTQIVDNNELKSAASAAKKEQESKDTPTEDQHFRELYEAISASELGSILPPPLCREIAEFGKLFVDSVLLTEEEQTYLVEMIESQSQTERFKNAEWKLLNRHSRDGDQFDWAYNEFHKLCDGKTNTICLMNVEETGWICGGYASAAWNSSGFNVAAKDDDAFLFVIRPENKRKIFHRKRDEEGKLIREHGILNSYPDGFNFGYNTFWWGDGTRSDEGQRMIQGAANNYYTFESLSELTGHDHDGWSDYSHWEDYEVFQLVE